MRSLTLTLAMCLGLIGCTKESAKPNVQVAPDIRSSFAIHQTHDVLRMERGQETELAPSEDQAKIRILKSALEKEFLWQPELLTQAEVARFSGLKSRIVAFRLRGQKLY